MDVKLVQRLADALPQGLTVHCHHLSTPPTVCDPIFAAPLDKDPEQTWCESHFLSISIEFSGRLLQIFATEVLIYTTQHLTTLFVSKADSTGYLHFAKIPRAHISPIRTICSLFLSHLTRQRQRTGISTVVALFARAQDQYLFPGSVENPEKHVLDDRGLIKWWCKVLDPVLDEYAALNPIIQPGKAYMPPDPNDFISKSYLVVPGCDFRETANFFPSHTKDTQEIESRWTSMDPLRSLKENSWFTPLRCLIPRFPDDPKARFVLDLDDELNQGHSGDKNKILENKNRDEWRSVKSMGQFWEMMSFRQECSAGRLVGFLWGVFSPPVDHREAIDESPGDEATDLAWPTKDGVSPYPVSSSQESNTFVSHPDFHNGASKSELTPTMPNSSRASRPIQLNAPKGSHTISEKTVLSPEHGLNPRSAKIHTASKSQSEAVTQPQQPLPQANADPLFWPVPGRGEIVLSEEDYKYIYDYMQRLDYGNEESAANSTRKWCAEVSIRAGGKGWGQALRGKKDSAPTTADSVRRHDGNLTGKNKRSVGERSDTLESVDWVSTGNGANVLAAGVMRKKPKLR
ncbi:hypothetical protein MMC20_001158 [Loxospora ochrophaea]|nr:hypothetical protein [Loxospora ochrophaea]